MKAFWKTGNIFLMMFFFTLAIRFAGQTKDASDIMTVFLEGFSPDPSAALEICEKEAVQETPASVCFWHEEKHASVFCRETGQSCALNDLMVTGDSELLVPGSSILAWQPKGCMLDTVSSEELFGTADASGQIIWYRDRSYTVFGTFESVQKTLIRKAQKEDSESLDRLSLRFSGSKTRKDDMEQFLIRYGLSGESADLQIFAVLAGDFCLLCPALAMAALVREMLRYRKKFLSIAAVCLAILSIWFLWSQIQIPPEMIPSRWSDLSFWTNWSKEQSHSLLLLLGSALGEGQLSVLFGIARSLLSSICALFFLSQVF